MKYLIIALAYAAVIPLWSVASMFLSAPNDVGFYTGVLVTVGTVAYIIFITKRLVSAITSDFFGTPKINSES
jgi:hypothetical protein